MSYLGIKSHVGRQSYRLGMSQMQFRVVAQAKEDGDASVSALTGQRLSQLESTLIRDAVRLGVDLNSVHSAIGLAQENTATALVELDKVIFKTTSKLYEALTVRAFEREAQKARAERDVAINIGLLVTSHTAAETVEHLEWLKTRISPDHLERVCGKAGEGLARLDPAEAILFLDRPEVGAEASQTTRAALAEVLVARAERALDARASIELLAANDLLPPAKLEQLVAELHASGQLRDLQALTRRETTSRRYLFQMSDHTIDLSEALDHLRQSGPSMQAIGDGLGKRLPIITTPDVLKKVVRKIIQDDLAIDLTAQRMLVLELTRRLGSITDCHFGFLAADPAWRA